MRVAVTGGDGFIGRPLVAGLRAAGHDVAASDIRRAEGVQSLDLRDRDGVDAWVAACRPDVVVALGAISGPMVAPDDPLLVFDTNATGTLNLLEAMRRRAVSRMVFVSSIAVYAARGDGRPVPESSPLCTIDPYSGSKVAAEAMVAAYCASFGLSSTVLRISTVYGPGRTTPYIISDLIGSTHGGPPARISGQAASFRQYVHVEDAATAVRLAVERPVPGFTPLNITGGSYVTEAEVAETIKGFLPATRYVTDPAKPGGDGDFGPLDISAAGRLIGYVPRVPLAMGLAALARAG